MQYGYKKAEFDASWNHLKKLQKIYAKKLSTENWQKNGVWLYRTNGVIIFIDYCTAPRDT